MNVKDIRRINLRTLARQTGGITSIAKLLGKSQSQISHLIGLNPVKNVGDKLAQEIERCFNKAPGWLDKEPNDLSHIDAGEIQYKKLEQNLTWVPVLTPQQLLTTDLSKLNNHKKEFYVVPIDKQLGNNLFALKIQEADVIGLQFTPQVKSYAIAIIEPQVKLENYGYILAASHVTEVPKIRQIIANDEGRFLAMLTPNGIKMVLNDQTKLYGVVKQIILNFA